MSLNSSHIKIHVPVPWSKRPLVVSLNSLPAVVVTASWLICLVLIMMQFVH